MQNGILVSVPDIVLPTRYPIRSEDVKSAFFWEAGAEFDGYIVGEPHAKAVEDTLRLQMKDPETKFNINGPDALRIADELDKAGVTVLRRHKK